MNDSEDENESQKYINMKQLAEEYNELQNVKNKLEHLLRNQEFVFKTFTDAMNLKTKEDVQIMKEIY